MWAGNAFKDKIISLKDSEINHKQEIYGGLHNCNIPGAINYYRSVLDCDNKSASRCVVVHNTKNCVGIAEFASEDLEFNARHLNYFSGKMDWLHITYIDALPNLRLSEVDLRKFDKISCDFCYSYENMPQDILLENLKYCDIVFGNTGKNIKEQYLDKMKNKGIIVLHEPWGFEVHCNYLVSSWSIQSVIDKCYKKYPFTLSAGDRFAAFMIEEMLKDSWKEEESYCDAGVVAYNKVQEWLQKVNETT